MTHEKHPCDITFDSRTQQISTEITPKSDISKPLMPKKSEAQSPIKEEFLIQSSQANRRSQSQNWIPAEISEMQRFANISDQASIADWADMLEPLDLVECSLLSSDDEEAIRVDESKIVLS